MENREKWRKLAAAKGLMMITRVNSIYAEKGTPALASFGGISASALKTVEGQLMCL